MSAIERQYSIEKHIKWVVCMGDFSLLRDTLSKKKNEKQTAFWTILSLIDSLLRGFGQVVFANNPISGMLIIGALGLTVTGVAIAGVATGVLGLLISVLIGGSPEHIENGLTVYNPLLIGAVTYSIFPTQYGNWDSFAILITLVSAIASVYLARSFANGKYPCITWPFNILQIMILLILMEQANDHPTNYLEKNTTELIQNKSTIINNNPDWGLVFRGILTSASQVFAVDNVAVGSTIYLAILIYSPVTAAFSFTGAFIGTISALGLGVPYDTIYSGLWGYNSLLTCSSLGGIFMVLNSQSIPLTFIAGVFTVFLQYIIYQFFIRIQLAVLTVPFVTTVWLFMGLRESEDNTFLYPVISTFPEDIRFNFFHHNQFSLDLASSNSVDENYGKSSISVFPDTKQ
ncbi:urea transporter 2-like isoform X3 [Aphidius gifuensis]|nr:urea transporter 2-like isoform X3 [Aphidius gifuensis]